MRLKLNHHLISRLILDSPCRYVQFVLVGWFQDLVPIHCVPIQPMENHQDDHIYTSKQVLQRLIHFRIFDNTTYLLNQI